jgi:signal peptidase I
MTNGVLSINGQALLHVSDENSQAAGHPETGTGPATPEWEIWPGGRKILILQQSTDGPLDSFGPVTVPQDHFFVLGDNRDNSADSRTFGLVERDQLAGRPIFLKWSHDLSRIGREIN